MGIYTGAWCLDNITSNMLKCEFILIYFKGGCNMDHLKHDIILTGTVIISQHLPVWFYCHGDDSAGPSIIHSSEILTLFLKLYLQKTKDWAHSKDHTGFVLYIYLQIQGVFSWKWTFGGVSDGPLSWECGGINGLMVSDCWPWPRFTKWAGHKKSISSNSKQISLFPLIKCRNGSTYLFHSCLLLLLLFRILLKNLNQSHNMAVCIC